MMADEMPSYVLLPKNAKQRSPPDGNQLAGITVLKAESKWRAVMIRKLRSGQYRLYSRKVDSKTGKRRNLGTFKSRAAAEKHEREVQYFKRH